jgi:hypothetical protein
VAGDRTRPIIPLAPNQAFRTLTPRRNRRFGVSDMTTCDEIEADKRSEQAQPDQAGAVLRDAGRCRNPGRVCGIILEL